MKVLHVSVVNKIATYQKRDGDIVCGNSDYQVKFAFDSEWSAHNQKTARFIWNGQFEDVDFSGDTCDVPKIQNTDEVKVGVYAGDLQTTTSAVIGCRRSILCEGATPSVENDKYYANRARESADRAEAAASEAAEAATAAAEAEVTRLVGELGVVQTTGVSPTSVISQAGASRSFANALEGKESGGAVLCEAVSPLLHPVGVRVRSRNLCSPFVNAADNPYVLRTAHISVQANTDYAVRVLANSNIQNIYVVAPDNTILALRAGVIGETASTFNTGNYTELYLQINTLDVAGDASNYKAMLNEGPTAEPYTPYVADGTAVRVRSGGANLIRYAIGTDTRGGITYTRNANGSITANGTAIGNTEVQICSGLVFPDGDYYLSGCPSGGTDKYNLRAWANDNYNNKAIDEGNGAAFSFDKSIDENIGIYIQIKQGVTVNNLVFKPTLNIGSTARPNEPYKAGQFIDTTVGATLDLESIAPYMSVYTDTAGTAVDVEYVKDTNAVFQKLVNAIVALGGNV